MAVIEHDFGDGLTVRNGSYLRRLQQRIPERLSWRHRRTGRAGGGAVTPDQTTLTLNTYNNDTPRENAFNQTDFVYKTVTGPVRHTIAFGTEFGRQTGLSLRNSGVFPNNASHNPFDHRQSVQPDLFRAGGLQTIIATDANSKYRLNIASGYVQDQIEVTRWLQLLVGARYDSFDLSAPRPEHQHPAASRVDE